MQPQANRDTDMPQAGPGVEAREIRRTTCYMCACRCGIEVHVEGGEVRHI